MVEGAWCNWPLTEFMLSQTEVTLVSVEVSCLSTRLPLGNGLIWFLARTVFGYRVLQLEPWSMSRFCCTSAVCEHSDSELLYCDVSLSCGALSDVSDWADVCECCSDLWLWLPPLSTGSTVSQSVSVLSISRFKCNSLFSSTGFILSGVFIPFIFEFSAYSMFLSAYGLSAKELLYYSEPGYGKYSKNLYSKILISKRKIPRIKWGK